MTKRGSQDNVITNEFICDSLEDLNQIDPAYVTLGSVAIILDGALEVYMANSNKQWINLSGGSESGGDN